MSSPKGAIPEAWIKEYVDQLIDAAKMFGDNAMGRSAIQRADHIMDMVKAYRDKPTTSADE